MSGARGGSPVPELVRVERRGAVALLVFDDPERRNAMTEAMGRALASAVAGLAADASVRAAVLTGAGSAFSAGGDLDMIEERSRAGREEPGPAGRAHSLAFMRDFYRLFLSVRELPCPSIAAIQGPAIGAGLAVALACDLRVAGDTARFATAFARVGYSGDFGGSWFLTQLVGTAKARELYYTAEILDAPAALALGLVNRVVPDARLEEETLALATRLARGPRVALRYMKRNMNAAEAGTLKDSLDLEAWHHTRTGFTEDHKEAAQAFMAKREPVFRGR